MLYAKRDLYTRRELAKQSASARATAEWRSEMRLHRARVASAEDAAAASACRGAGRSSQRANVSSQVANLPHRRSSAAQKASRESSLHAGPQRWDDLAAIVLQAAERGRRARLQASMRRQQSAALSQLRNINPTSVGVAKVRVAKAERTAAAARASVAMQALVGGHPRQERRGRPTEERRDDSTRRVREKAPMAWQPRPRQRMMPASANGEITAMRTSTSHSAPRGDDAGYDGDRDGVRGRGRALSRPTRGHTVTVAGPAYSDSNRATAIGTSAAALAPALVTGLLESGWVPPQALAMARQEEAAAVAVQAMARGRQARLRASQPASSNPWLDSLCRRVWEEAVGGRPLALRRTEATVTAELATVTAARTQAAVAVQAVFRGRHTRRRVRDRALQLVLSRRVPLPPELSRRISLPTQTAWAARAAAQRTEATMTVQAALRQRQARQLVEQKREALLTATAVARAAEERARAAAAVQAAARGQLARRHMESR